MGTLLCADVEAVVAEGKEVGTQGGVGVGVGVGVGGVGVGIRGRNRTKRMRRRMLMWTAWVGTSFRWSMCMQTNLLFLI
jgi:hypothetical protein